MPELRSWIVFLLIWSLSDADLHNGSLERQVFISFFTSAVSLECNNERVCFGGTLMWAIVWQRSISAWHTPAERANHGYRAEGVFFNHSSASTFPFPFITSTDNFFVPCVLLCGLHSSLWLRDADCSWLNVWSVTWMKGVYGFWLIWGWWVPLLGLVISLYCVVM